MVSQTIDIMNESYSARPIPTIPKHLFLLHLKQYAYLATHYFWQSDHFTFLTNLKFQVQLHNYIASFV